MNEYFVCFDCIEDYFEAIIVEDNYKQVVTTVENLLEKFGGGHADIFDEDGDFVEDVEI